MEDTNKVAAAESAAEQKPEQEILPPTDTALVEAGDAIEDLSDLNTIAGSNEGAVLHLRHPGNGAPLYIVDPTDQNPEKTKRRKLPMRITCYGVDSARWRKKIRKVGNKQIEARMRRGGKVTYEQQEADDLELAITCTKSWENIYLEGKALPFNDYYVQTFYETNPWALEQALEFMRDRSNFLKVVQTS